MTVSDDKRFMRRCLALASRAAGRTSPNPMVGCVIVSSSGKVLAEGWHRRAGEPHAEADALAKLHGKAKGATLYVNLEPCAHTSKRRTAPCTPLVQASGISRLVCGLADPFPGHGGGLAILRKSGVVVDGPVLADECHRLNEAFVVYATCGRAHVTLKAAVTLDGKIATVGGQSRWITGEEARADVHRQRSRIDAVLVGVGTVLADDPLLTVRNVRDVPRARDPVRVILDSRLRTPPSASLFTSTARVLIATTEAASAKKERALAAKGAQIWRSKGIRVDIKALVRELAKQGIISVLVEGGAETHASFIAAKLCDRVLLYVAPTLVGGPAPSWIGGRGIERLADALRLRFDAPPKRLGQDWLLSAVPA